MGIICVLQRQEAPETAPEEEWGYLYYTFR